MQEKEIPAQSYVRAHLRPPDKDTVNWGAAPARFKIYKNCERLSCSYEVPGQETNENAHGLTREHIGQILLAIYGLTRQGYFFGEDGATPLLRFLQVSPIPEAHTLKPLRTLLRPVPSGGALFPCELYLLAGQTGTLQPGTYHYDAAHHALQTIRNGDYSHMLQTYLSHPEDVYPAYTLLLSCAFWKNGFKYGAFSYRLQGMDIGAVIAQSEFVASKFGLNATVHYHFFDQAINDLIGLDSRYESVYAVITLTSDAKVPAYVSASVPEKLPLKPPPSAVEQLEPIDRWPLAAAVHFASLIQTPDQFHPLHSLPAIEMPKSLKSLKLPFSDNPLDLWKSRYQRHSAGGLFHSVPLTARQLAELLTVSLRASANDIDKQTHHLQHTLLYCMVNAVETIPAGIYCYHPTYKTLELIRAGDVLAQFSDAFQQYTNNTFHASVNFFLVGDYENGFRVYGDRWYRLQNMEAGIILQRLYLAAAALGLACRATLGYHEQSVNAFLGLPENYASLVQVMVSPAHLIHQQYEHSLLI